MTASQQSGAVTASNQPQGHTPQSRGGSGLVRTGALILAALVIAFFPMLFHFGQNDAEEAFGGTDDAAESIIETQNPTYQPWASPVIGELPGEVESGLFALQAALGAGVVGFALGNLRGAHKERLAHAELQGATETR